MAVGPHVVARRHRSVGNHHVEVMHRQFRQQGRQPPLTAHQAHRRIERQRRRHQAVSHLLGHRVCNADTKGGRLCGMGVVQHIEQLIAEREDLLRVAQNALAGLGHHQAPPGALKQAHAQTLFKRRDLPADRLRRQVQLLTRAGNAACLGHHPEVAQMFVVERRHGANTS